MTNPDDLLKRIHDTRAVSIWNRKTGPVFWYAANVPGPFYVNTELVIGPRLAAGLLEKITAIVANANDPAARAQQLNEAILDAYRASADYQKVIAAMIAKAKAEFPPNAYDLVSGGERRDWLFSIPFAEALGLRHVFLFKDGRFYCAQSLKTAGKVLHISDLINNAASYFDRWFPILEKAQLRYVGTVCLNSRGTNGLARLAAHEGKTVVLNHIDAAFFEQSCRDGLIDGATFEEIETYFASPKDWARRYLMKDIALFDVPHIDKKSLERLKAFFTADPWDLEKDHKDFFAAMRKEIGIRG